MEWCETDWLAAWFEGKKKNIFVFVLACLLLCAAAVYPEYFSSKVSVTEQKNTDISGNAVTDSISQEQMEKLRKAFADTINAGTAVRAEPAVINAGQLPAPVPNSGEKSVSGGEAAAKELPLPSEVKAEPVSAVTEEVLPEMKTESTSAIVTDKTEAQTEEVTPILPDDTQIQQAEPEPIVIDGFLVDESGTIYGVQDPEAVAPDGYLQLPSEGCSKIAAGAFAEGFPSVREIYVPSNITDIEEGAFVGMPNVEWYDVENGSPFTSCEGVLFAKGQTMLLAFPSGRTGNYQLPSGVTEIGKEAFSEAKISGLDSSFGIPSGIEFIPDSIQVLLKQEPDVSVVY